MVEYNECMTEDQFNSLEVGGDVEFRTLKDLENDPSFTQNARHEFKTPNGSILNGMLVVCGNSSIVSYKSHLIIACDDGDGYHYKREQLKKIMPTELMW